MGTKEVSQSVGGPNPTGVPSGSENKQKEEIKDLNGAENYRFHAGNLYRGRMDTHKCSCTLGCVQIHRSRNVENYHGVIETMLHLQVQRVCV